MIHFGQYAKGTILFPEDTVKEIERQCEGTGLSGLVGDIDASDHDRP
jgi:hypothetical protein